LDPAFRIGSPAAGAISDSASLRVKMSHDYCFGRRAAFPCCGLDQVR
jgi:hypothetical protein